MPGLDRAYSVYFSGLTRETFLARLRRALLGGEPPESVVLLDIDPPSQKTYPDFVATKEFTGIDAVCPTSLIREGRRLFRKVDGKLIEVRSSTTASSSTSSWPRRSRCRSRTPTTST